MTNSHPHSELSGKINILKNVCKTFFKLLKEITQIGLEKMLDHTNQPHLAPHYGWSTKNKWMVFLNTHGFSF